MTKNTDDKDDGYGNAMEAFGDGWDYDAAKAAADAVWDAEGTKEDDDD